MYSAEFAPDWVGEPEGDVDYRELLQNAGVDVPAVDDSDPMDDVADDGGSMDDAADDDVDDNSTMEGQDVQVGTPVQGSTVGDVDPKSPAVIDTQEQTQVHTHSHQQQHPSTPLSAGASTAPPMRRPIQRRIELPAAILTTKSKVVPVKIAEVSEPVLRRQSPAWERLVGAEEAADTRPVNSFRGG